jgi:hypothetical protein
VAGAGVAEAGFFIETRDEDEDEKEEESVISDGERR